MTITSPSCPVGPNPSNQADCQTFADFPATATVAAGGQISGSGCVFPASVPTVANQLTTAGLTWKGYMEDMGNLATRETSTCGHPAVGSADLTQKAVPGDGYATRHDPFVYFHSIIDNPALCNSHVVPLGTTAGSLPTGTPSGTTGLQKDLQAVSSTPNFSFITPNLCNDGHDSPCVNQTGQASQLANIDVFLQQWVPLITNSAAFKKDGLLEITFDEADIGDATACCGEVAGPAAPKPGINGPGGGRIGTVLVSRSSIPEPSARCRTTTTRRWPPSRTCSAWPDSLRPRRPAPPSGRTCSVRACRRPAPAWRRTGTRPP